MQVLDAYAEAMGIPTLGQMVENRLRSKRENAFHPVVPVDDSKAIELNRLKWEKKAEKARKQGLIK